MYHKAFTLSALVAIFALGACGGTAVVVGDPGRDDFDTLVQEAESLVVKLDGLRPTDVMPNSGEVTYEGIIILVDDIDTSTEGVLGSTNLTANFATETISGNSSNFYTATIEINGDIVGGGAEVDGQLAHSGSDFTTSDTVTLQTSGDVVIEGTLRSIDGEIFAAFAGPNADMLAGLGIDMPAGAINVDAAIVVD